MTRTAIRMERKHFVYNYWLLHWDHYVDYGDLNIIIIYYHILTSAPMRSLDSERVVVNPGQLTWDILGPPVLISETMAMLREFSTPFGFMGSMFNQPFLPCGSLSYWTRLPALELW